MISQTKERCLECYLHKELCICALVPHLKIETKVIIIMHDTERFKPSNTGRLLLQCLVGSEMRVRGTKDRQPTNLSGLDNSETENLLLSLHPDAELLTEKFVSELKKPVQLIVPDGSWSQAARMGSKLLQQLPKLRRVSLLPDKPSIYRLRSEHHPAGMATFEAVALALKYLERSEGIEIEKKMTKIFQIMTDRVLWTRGKLRAEDVCGGLPMFTKK
ncbi:MAG: DTW domain-containing protein [Oligoflexia bacterium]|nr:DTW domain-containing protein [Oligoflexia bacterium]